MSQSKLWAVHAEADKLPELIAIVEGALGELRAKLGGVPSAPEPAAPAPTPITKGKAAAPAPTPITKGKAAAPAPAAPEPKAEPAGARVTLDQVKNGLTELKTAIDAVEGPEKKLGIKAIHALLAPFKVTRSTDLTEDQYGPVMAEIQDQLSRASSEGY